MANQNGFFVVEKARFYAACDLGMSATVAYLVLCNGTGRSNTITSWSIHAIEKYTNISRGRAKLAIRKLIEKGIIWQLKAGSRPSYQVKDKHKGKLDSTAIIWLPSGIVQGVAGEVSPLERIRGTQEIMLLRLFVDLYGVQNLVDDSGLPLAVHRKISKRKKLGQSGLYNIFGFTDFKSLVESGGVWSEHEDKSPPKGCDRGHAIFTRYGLLVRLGLVVEIPYLFDGTMPENNRVADFEGEVVHALDGDIGIAVAGAAEALLLKIGGEGLASSVFDFEYVVPVPVDKPNVSVIVVSQLRYKAKTKMTGKWFSAKSASEKAFLARYLEITGDEQKTGKTQNVQHQG